MLLKITLHCFFFSYADIAVFEMLKLSSLVLLISIMRNDLIGLRIFFFMSAINRWTVETFNDFRRKTEKKKKQHRDPF